MFEILALPLPFLLAAAAGYMFARHGFDRYEKAIDQITACGRSVGSKPADCPRCEYAHPRSTLKKIGANFCPQCGLMIESHNSVAVWMNEQREMLRRRQAIAPHEGEAIARMPDQMIQANADGSYTIKRGETFLVSPGKDQLLLLRDGAIRAVPTIDCG